MSQVLPRPDGEADPGARTVDGVTSLVDHLRAGLKTGPLRVGVEHELLGVHPGDGRAMGYEGPHGIGALLTDMARRFGHTPVSDGNHVVALLRKGGGCVSLEPGGQVELSGAASENLHETERELDGHLAQLGEVARDLGVVFLGVGYRPAQDALDVPQMPKARYGVMTPYLARAGRRGLEMMRSTCTVQANLDFISEEDMGLKLQAALGVSSLVTALFANSPFALGRATGHQSERMLVWNEVDPTRCGLPGFALQEPADFRAWVEHVLDVPVIFLRRGGHHVAPPAGLTFRRWMAGTTDLPRPTHADFDDVLSTLFTDVRLKTYLEVRTADVGPRAHLMALPALWKGLLYDDGARRRAWNLVAGLDLAGHLALRRACAVDGLRARHGGVGVREACVELCLAAQDGLRQQGFAGEARWIEPMLQRARSGVTLADELLAHPGTPLQAALELTGVC